MYIHTYTYKNYIVILCMYETQTILYENLL